MLTGYLPVSGGHTIYYEIHGSMKHPPVILLHGGPGGGIQRRAIHLYLAKKFCVITFDQRGCGKSTPFGSLVNNTTLDIVEDIEALRNHLDISKWIVSGGSWGTTLGLIYAEKYPHVVTGLILRSVCLMDAYANTFLYQQGGASEIYPEAWESFTSVLPATLKKANWKKILEFYQKKMQGSDRDAFAKSWCAWENAVSFLHPRKDDTPKSEMLSLALLEIHYFIHNCWIKEEQILRDAHKLKHIPIVTVHGRYDLVCPNKGSWDLHKALPHTKVLLVPDGGHAGSEKGTFAAHKKAIAMFAKMRRVTRRR